MPGRKLNTLARSKNVVKESRFVPFWLLLDTSCTQSVGQIRCYTFIEMIWTESAQLTLLHRNNLVPQLLKSSITTAETSFQWLHR
jgi:hypothetical protein